MPAGKLVGESTKLHVCLVNLKLLKDNAGHCNRSKGYFKQVHFEIVHHPSTNGARMVKAGWFVTLLILVRLVTVIPSRVILGYL